VPHRYVEACVTLWETVMAVSSGTTRSITMERRCKSDSRWVAFLSASWLPLGRQVIFFCLQHYYTCNI